MTSTLLDRAREALRKALTWARDIDHDPSDLEFEEAETVLADLDRRRTELATALDRPNGGACSGDGSVCEDACKVEKESPSIVAETGNENAPDAGLIEQLERAYLPPQVPPCRICGAELSIASMGGGYATVYRCSAVKPVDGKFDWKHYEQSEWQDYRQGGDPRVIELVKRYRALSAPAQPVALPGVPEALSAVERKRQIEIEDCTLEDDGKHSDIEFAYAEVWEDLAREHKIRLSREQELHDLNLKYSSAHNSLVELTARLDSAAMYPSRVRTWMLTCFGEVVAADRGERNHRFVEEALELAQACEMPKSDAHALVEHVYGRPVGEPSQEVGGVMVTLAALCLANGLDMHRCGEVELARIDSPNTIEKIRAKQATKPKGSALPMKTVALDAVTAEALAKQVAEACGERIENLNYGTRLIMEKSARAHLAALAALGVSTTAVKPWNRIAAEIAADILQEIPQLGEFAPLEDPSNATGLAHLHHMADRLRSHAVGSPTKACRWLGWLQAGLVAAGLSNLEREKARNYRAAARHTAVIDRTTSS